MRGDLPEHAAATAHPVLDQRIGAIVEEQIQDVLVASHVQRGVAVPVLRPHTRSGLEQAPRALQVRGGRREVQSRRVGQPRPLIDSSAGPEQDAEQRMAPRRRALVKGGAPPLQRATAVGGCVAAIPEAHHQCHPLQRRNSHPNPAARTVGLAAFTSHALLCTMLGRGQQGWGA